MNRVATAGQLDCRFFNLVFTSKDRRTNPVLPYYEELVDGKNQELENTLAGVLNIQSSVNWIIKSKSSGFLISSDGLCLTAAHCIHHKPVYAEPLIHYSQDKKEIMLEAEVVSVSRYDDLALLKLPDSNYPNYFKFSQEALQRGDFVFSLGRNGFTAGQLLKDSNEAGTLTHMAHATYDSIISTNSTSRGDSGCALVNPKGEVVGLVNSGLGEDQNVWSKVLATIFCSSERFRDKTIQTPFRNTTASIPTRRILDFLDKAKINVDRLLTKTN